MCKRLLLFISILPPIAGAGCHPRPMSASRNVEAQVTAVASVPAAVSEVPLLQVSSPQEAPAIGAAPSLKELWDLALKCNPLLREAACDVEAARGQWLQASKYLNPSLVYQESKLGDSRNEAGALSVGLQQEIITARKRQWDMAVAAGSTNTAWFALLVRKFDVLTRIRRAYYDYSAVAYIVQVNDEVVATLAQDTEIIRRQVEEVQSRPHTDLVRIQALLEDAKVGQIRSRINLKAAWEQLAAEVGAAELAQPQSPGEIPTQLPIWHHEAVFQRVLAASSELRQLSMQVERARALVARAEAAAVPNVTVGGGYTQDFTDGLPGGGIVSVQLPLPVYDRRQGQIYETQARLVQAQAAIRSAALRLERDTADALARYQGAYRQQEQLINEVLPKLQQGLDEVRKGYEAGAAQITFADVLLSEQNLNAARLLLANTRRELWRAIADLQGLMQLDLDEDLEPPGPPN